MRGRKTAQELVDTAFAPPVLRCRPFVQRVERDAFPVSLPLKDVRMEAPMAIWYPEFSWSYSRESTLHACPRRYYYAYYAAPVGRHSGMGEETWIAAMLKRLTTPELVLGTAVHQRAREILVAVLVRRPRPEVDLLIRRTRADLNHVYRTSLDRRAFLRDPERKMFLALYYERGLSEERVERIRRKAEQCVRNLAECPLWDELEQCEPASVLAVDRISSFLVHGHTVFASPDLVYRPTPGACTICDWKTGSPEGTRNQLALYALFVRDGMGIATADGTYRGRVFALADGAEEEYVLTPGDLDEAAERVATGVERMHALLVDAERNVPKPKHAFPLTSRRGRCPTCPYFELCAEEIWCSPEAVLTLPRTPPAG